MQEKILDLVQKMQKKEHLGGAPPFLLFLFHKFIFIQSL